MTSETDIQYEVWQDGDMVAAADSPSDAQHFMLVYGQDGPVEAKTAVTVRTPGFNARTPAPEGEVVAWGCFDANGLDDKLVYRDRRRAEDAAFAFTPSMTVKPLYASPVVPVEVSRAEIARIVGGSAVKGGGVNPFEGSVADLDWAAWQFADAILAALRPTDTGGEA